jgi:hypothetical protein
MTMKVPYFIFLLCLSLFLGCGGEREKTGVEVQFVDVTESAGIEFLHVNGSSGEKYFPESMGSGVSFLDYDRDGHLDLFLVNSGPLPGYPEGDIPKDYLYRNNGDGTFSDVTEAAGLGDSGYGMGIACGDYNNDGYPDIYITNFGPNRLYENNGDGTFRDVTQKAGVGDTLWSSSAAFSDIDRDGFLDLFVCNFLEFSVKNHPYCGDRKRGIRAYCHPDFYKGLPDVLYRNNGDGTFTDITREAGVYNSGGKGLGVVFTDYDNDGDPDIFVANDSVRNFLFRNQGDGTFQDATMEANAGYNEDGKTEACMGVDFGDYDNDGHFDLFVTNLDFETNTLYRNSGDGTFYDATFSAGLGEASLLFVGWGTNFFDYDNDRDQDLFVANGHVIDNVDILTGTGEPLHPPFLFENKGNGSFINNSQERGEYFRSVWMGRGAAFGDYDSDGDVDMFITHNNSRGILLRNDGGNRGSWLQVKTVGTRSNRDGIGARIILTDGDRIQMDEVKSGGSYLSQNDLRVHFGLGMNTEVKRLEIRWPSGLVETYKNIKTNQVLLLKEGEG